MAVEAFPVMKLYSSPLRNWLFGIQLFMQLSKFKRFSNILDARAKKILMIFWLSGLVIGGCYAALIGFYRHGWKGVAPEELNSGTTTFFTVLVPARNEAAHLPQLLEALLAQQYPAECFEVLVLDDHSSDGTAAIAEAAGGNVRVLRLPPGVEGKKAAITQGVNAAHGPWIVTTDADCLPGPLWLRHFAASSERAAFVAAPVRYQHLRTLCDRFQALDFLTLQGITAASVASGFHSMCNGANLAYSKEAFLEAGGFAGIDHVASGDDLLLMHKIALRHPGKIHYRMHPDAIVDTDPAPGWRAFWKQRVRWASKSAQYDDKRIFGALLLVYAFNLWFVVTAIASFWDAARLLPLLLLLVLKTIVELRFLAPVARFFGQAHLLKWFPWMQPLHILYTVFVGALSQVGKYEWKGRKVR
ncbi:glycosyltransferase [Flaviaesturariibacter aridisoli]|uniref:Glycosyltransferase n=2 Tax=Flaviaesturariibacter aridisoli TaxID=2545761 RepID=A0A4R4E531_9BACT|nr:glycosyltransferase [Flaviaesturariibacter aridisoli]